MIFKIVLVKGLKKLHAKYTRSNDIESFCAISTYIDAFV